MKTKAPLLPGIPDSLNAEYAKLCAPKRAWALAKAFAETQRERSFAEQREATANVTADDPEPDWTSDSWQAWYDRNQERMDAATKPIIEKYRVGHWEDLAKEAERNMVEWAKERMQHTYTPEQFAGIKPAFEAYEEHRIYGGDLLDKFLNIIFRCPE